LTIRLSDEEYNFLKSAAKENNVSVSEVVRRMVATYPDVLEKAAKFDTLVVGVLLKKLEKDIEGQGGKNGA